MNIYDGKAKHIMHPEWADGTIKEHGKEIDSLGMFVVAADKREYFWAALNPRTVAAMEGQHKDVAVIMAAMAAFGLESPSGLLGKKKSALKALGINKFEKAKLSAKRINVTIGWEQSRDLGDMIIDCAKADPVKSGQFLREVEAALRNNGIGGCSIEAHDGLMSDRKAEAKGRASDDSVTIYVDA